MSGGEQAEGPCEALFDEGGKLVCGIMKQPTDWIAGEKSPIAVRQAFGLVIGVGIGCDDPGCEPDETAQPKIDKIKRAFMASHTVAELKAAVALITEHGTLATATSVTGLYSHSRRAYASAWNMPAA